MDNYFKFDGRLIRDKTWAYLSLAAKAVFPVIACHCNKYGEAFPAEKRIGDLAGLTEKTVRKGINDLEEFNILKVSRYTTSRGHSSKRFYIQLPGNGNNLSKSDCKAPFPFYGSIILTFWRCWKNLKPSAKAIYPVMRYFGFSDNNDIDEYLKRNFDCCTAEPNVLAEYAGISTKILKSSLNNLSDNYLIDVIEESNSSSWQVYLRPETPM